MNNNFNINKEENMENKEFEGKKKKIFDKRKKTIIASSIALAMVVATTLTYFTTSDFITNVFNTAKYGTTIHEEFVSPSDWTPGTTTSKTIKVTNKGSIDMALRAKYTEKWVNANGKELSLQDDNKNTVAQIHFDPSWTKASDGYYYYGSKTDLTHLAPNAVSTSFITGVTYNPNVQASLTQTKSDDGKTITYTSTGNGYDNATYTLTVYIDTIQYDQAHNFWK